MDSPDYSEDSDDSSSFETVECDDTPKNTFIQPKITDLGKHVIYASGNGKHKYGVLRYMGEPEFSEGVWCGIELDQCTGKNNGSVHGIRYFTCNSNFGVFLPLSKVELDTNRRSRNRPNSQQPSTRASSVDRKDRPNSNKSTTSGAMNPPVHRMSIPHELVSRLSQPLKRSSQPNISIGRRLPMKAFATKGVKISSRETKKPLTPFRSGGIYKAASSENIRGLNDKDNTKHRGTQRQQGMLTKKSSSEKDLRNAGKMDSKVSSNVVLLPKVKRKQIRVNSCSDLLAPDIKPTTTTTTTTSDGAGHVSLENYAWPRTSTPGNRDELTPDGCSSPEESEDALAKEKQSIMSVATPNKGFLETPCDKALLEGTGKQSSSNEGLTTHIKQFTEAEMISPSTHHASVQSPEHDPAPRKYFKNPPSGKATLSHPLASSIITNGADVLKQLLGSKQTLEGVSIDALIDLFEQQANQWQSIVADLEFKLLEKERLKKDENLQTLQQKLSEAQKTHEAKICQLIKKHQMEINTLNGAHAYAMEEYKKSHLSSL